MSAAAASTPAPSTHHADRVLVPMLALLGGALAAAGQSGLAQSVVAGFTAAVVVVLAATDLRRRVIPNRIVLPATLAVLLFRLAFLPSHALSFVWASALSGLALLLLNLVTRSGIGMGDVKFMLLIGAALGAGAFGAISIAFFALFPVALVVLIRGGLAARKTWLPFGPFLALGTLSMLIVPTLLN